ncbi:MAG: hypothetical protein A3F72_14475 [Bacteroidetes bacterium RIFCSPLOWO2_12_FULL_35_15]|nr:MAG: hypothetical protein A3F72_14475 [Bacteroidetes bacterium RIFCSPLOWO2_12_FULL_35_15]
MDNMKHIYIEEAKELFESLEKSLLVLEKFPNDKTAISEVFRIMHTIKGSSGMFGYTNITQFLHNLETIYDLIRNEKRQLSKEILDVTLQSLDHLKVIIHDDELIFGNNKKKHNELLITIEFLINENGAEKTESIIENEEAVSSLEWSTYYIKFIPSVEILKKGTNPLYLIDELHSLGECIALPRMKELCSLELTDPSCCYTAWEVFIASNSSIETLKEVFVFVENECTLTVSEIAPFNLIADKTFCNTFCSNTLEADFINTEDINEWVDNQIQNENKQSNSKAITVPKHYTEIINQKEKSITSIRVSSDKLDELMGIVSELVTTQAGLKLLAENTNNMHLDAFSETIEKLTRRLRDVSFGMTLIPVNTMFGRFQRLVRDISYDLNKEIDFVTEGGETELDKTIIESLTDPLMHILRNCLDHGIENAEERKKKGKSPKGKITLKAYYSGASVYIQVSDDGKGIDLDKIRSKAIEKGLIQHDSIMSDKEILELIYAPGFSTAEKITGVSGRGVGMDVVKRNISNLHGEISTETEIDQGSKFSIKLPLTLSIIDGLLVKIGNVFYIIPLSVVDKCYEVKRNELDNFNKLIVFDGNQIPFLDLRVEFEVHEKEPLIQHVIVVNNEDRKVGLGIDSIVGEYQAVVKPLGKHYNGQDYISGATILGDGTIALVLDSNRIIKRYKINHLRTEELV